jgi:GntR family transcriptional regulator
MSDELSIDRRSIVLQLRDELRREILTSSLGAGHQLPSEAEMSARFHVARGTVREALKLLEQGGLVEVQQGRGRFVSAIASVMVTRPVTEFESVTEMLRGLGYELTNRVLSVEVVAADEEQAAALGLQPGAPVVRLRRLRLHKREALIYDINAFSADLLGGRSAHDIDFTGSLNAWLESIDRGPVSSAATIRAVTLPAEIAALPEIDSHQPWLLIGERCVDRQGMAVLFSQDFHRGDVFSFQVLRQRSGDRSTHG